MQWFGEAVEKGCDTRNASPSSTYSRREEGLKLWRGQRGVLGALMQELGDYDAGVEWQADICRYEDVEHRPELRRS
jgi:hypothetical protein